ncbi:hypothetical protein LOK49_LG15G01261 [Camellia lanceoleosa]|uniref:Uncharacterized protein n=1 Tax=Camellia lanceoleosa TaxID=1840588 RepID=A0ACC0F4L8_9ERIC|nr:hypothetical protein LOK49_LG15G01261 [Camellia lanceoleosa]
MPTIAGHGSSPFAAADELIAIKARRSGEIRSTGDSTPRKRTLRSNSAAEDCSIASIPSPKLCSPTKWKSPRRCINGSPNGPAKALPYTVFQPQALELCARKVAAASGDMRKALCICRNAIEMLEAELRDSACNLDLSSAGNGYSDQRKTPVQGLIMQETDIVRVNHMAVALSKTYRSPILDTIQSLPQHQQIILCSAVKLFCRGKKDTTIGELSKSYLDICKLILIPPVGIMELSNMCRVLGDQGLLKLGQSREDKLRRVTLKVDEADIAFALQGVRVFRNCLQ